MDKYYYFSAQLPLLNLEQVEDVPSKGFFLDEAEKWLTKKDLDILSSTDLNVFMLEKKNSFLKKFCVFECDLRSELSKYRQSQKEDFEYKTNLFPMSFLKEGTPLETEKKLLQFRWAFLSENELGHYSDLEFLIVYYLKLQILWRLASFDKEKGEAEFKDVTILEIADKGEES